jgi:hypothetical protein
MCILRFCMAFAGWIGYKNSSSAAKILAPLPASKADPKKRYLTQSDVRFQ